MRRWWKRLAVLAIVILILVALRVTVFRPDPVPVTVFVVSRGRVEQTVTNSKAGTVRARRRAKLSPEIGGRVAEVRAHEGDRVEAGTVLLRLDDTELRSRLSLAGRAIIAAQQAEREACLSAELAVREYRRTADLARERLVSEQLLDQAKNRQEVAGASCEAARARTSQIRSEQDLARSQLAKTTLRAPFGGVVAEMVAEQGEWITPSPPGIAMPAVIDLIDPGSIYVSAPIDEVDRGKVVVGQPARITLDAYPDQFFPGSVLRIAPYIQDVAEQSRTFEVEAAFANPVVATRIPPGASADVEVILGARENVMRVPAYALLEGKRVLVLVPDCARDAGPGRRILEALTPGDDACLAGREVTVGMKNWEFAEVTGGLLEGDRVVVSLDRAEVKAGARARQSAVTEK